MSAAGGLDARLARVPEVLSRVGYADFIGALAPMPMRPERWRLAAAEIDGELGACVRLLLLAEPTKVDELPGPLVRLLPALAEAGVATVADRQACLGDLVLLRLHGVWLFAQRPQPSPTMYVGDDSVGLIERLDPAPGPCLDLCAGPGVQALVLATRGWPVVAVELNPVAAAVCRVNVAVNGLAERVSVRSGDLYAPVAGETFATVTTNPPLLPVPGGVPYPFVGDGGPDGLRVVRRVLAGLPRHLTSQGRAQLVGIGLSDGFLPLMMDELSGWALRDGFDLTVSVTAHVTTDFDGEWVRGLAATSATHGQADYDGIRTALARGYADLRASHVCTYALRVARGTGRVRHVDVSAAHQSGSWWFV